MVFIIRDHFYEYCILAFFHIHGGCSCALLALYPQMALVCSSACNWLFPLFEYIPQHRCLFCIYNRCTCCLAGVSGIKERQARPDQKDDIDLYAR